MRVSSPETKQIIVNITVRATELKQLIYIELCEMSADIHPDDSGQYNDGEEVWSE